MNLKSAFVLLLVAALLAACQTTPPRVDCEGHLTPINAPAPVRESEDSHP